MPRGRGVGRVDDDVRLGLRRVLAPPVGERGVEEEVRLRRQQRKREAPRELLVGDLAGRVVERQRVEPGLGEPLAAQLELAGRRREAALGVRARALAAVDLGVAALAQAGQADARRVALERLREHLLVALVEARVREAERVRQQPEDLAVGARLAERARSPAR